MSPPTPVTFPAKSHRVGGLKVPPRGRRALAPAGVICGAPAPPGPLPAAVPLIILQAAVTALKFAAGDRERPKCGPS